jgi:hypothetical protein
MLFFASLLDSLQDGTSVLLGLVAFAVLFLLMEILERVR